MKNSTAAIRSRFRSTSRVSWLRCGALPSTSATCRRAESLHPVRRYRSACGNRGGATSTVSSPGSDGGRRWRDDRVRTAAPKATSREGKEDACKYLPSYAARPQTGRGHPADCRRILGRFALAQASPLASQVASGSAVRTSAGPPRRSARGARPTWQSIIRGK